MVLPKKHLKKVYQLPFKITKEVKLVMFQYKIIHNILPTQRDGIAESDICPLCKNERQTLYHLFVLCTEVHSFWNTFQDWWLQKTHVKLSLNQSNILYRFFEKIFILAGFKLLNTHSKIPHLLYTPAKAGVY